MKFQKRPELHIPRSARGKRSARRKGFDAAPGIQQKDLMCAFDMLATVAGQILADGDDALSPALGSAAQENLDETKPLKVEIFDQDSCNEAALVSNATFPKPASCPALIQSAIPISTPAKPYESATSFSKTDCGGSSSSPGLDRWSPDSMESGYRVGHHDKVLQRSDDAPEMYSMLNPMDIDAKPPPLVSSDSSGEMSLYSGEARCSSPSQKGRKRLNCTAHRDDDGDNFSVCTDPCTATNMAFRPNYLSDCRGKKMLGSKLRKAASFRLYKGELSYTDSKKKSAIRSKICVPQRTEGTKLKKRKLFHSVREATENVILSHGIVNSSENGGAGAAEAAAMLAPTSEAQRANSSFKAKDGNVRLNIKSLRVPELEIEIAEDATVGSLKRAVLDAVKTIIGDGIHVGVLLHGKKVGDDCKTLAQAGIFYGEEVESLGFSLEPSSVEMPVTQDDSFHDADHTSEPMPICVQPVDSPTQPETCDVPALLALTAPEVSGERGYDSAHSSPGMEFSNNNNDLVTCRAIVPVRTVDPGALAVVPLRKAKRSEHGQRRIRRPFSVQEVEALVDAVEKLGTGRWRDVKIQAFDNAKHRTYVDLKDKWKTLVHTASIAPQQRRGEPVPQNLLDRVLSTQAYWSQQQAKLQLKAPVA